ncbi:MAG: 30S ribosomal protein S20 [Spirochaetales bacterium]|nr:30S ribosomal protein S20 [Spirochaetales bacterium]
MLSGGLEVANNLSAIKRQKQSEKKRLRNKMIKSRIKTSARMVREAIVDKNSEVALKNFEEFKSLVDRAVIKGVYHKNNAARKKSRMYRLVMGIKV